jgi:hypothetical protein
MADFKERVCKPKLEVDIEESNLIVDLASTKSNDVSMMKNAEDLKKDLIIPEV